MTRAKRKEWRTPGTFQVFASRKCAACGHIWEPAASLGWLVVGVAVGLFFLVTGVNLVWTGRAFSGIAAIVLGVGAWVGCVERWRARSRA